MTGPQTWHDAGLELKALLMTREDRGEGKSLELTTRTRAHSQSSVSAKRRVRGAGFVEPLRAA